MALVVFAAVFLDSACVAATRKPVAMNLCTLATHAKQFDHKLVRVQGVVRSDGIEHTALLDESCPTKAAALSISYEDDAPPGAKGLFNAIYRDGQIGTIGKHITAVITGVFLSHPGKRPPRELVVKSVSDLKVSRQQ